MRAYPGLNLVVVLPTVLVVLYYGLIAADIYVSTAQFVVMRANQPTAMSNVGSLLQTAGISGSTTDTYAVDSYLQSRDALAELEQNPGIRDVYDRPEGDFVARFPNLLFGPSFENLFLYYSYWVDVSYDTTANVTTLSVYAFRPDDAQAVARRLLALGEQAVNRMNDRSRADLLRGAHHEVELLQQRAAAIQDQITLFRTRELLLDPNQTSAQSVALVAALESEIVSARAAITQLQQSAPGSPQISVLRTRIVSLENQTVAEERKMAGGDASLAPKLAEYDQLLLKQQFVAQMLQAAVASLQAAEASVQQQQLYLEHVADPNRPDLAQYPQRLLNVVVVLLTSLILYGIGRMLVGAVMAHADY